MVAIYLYIYQAGNSVDTEFLIVARSNIVASYSIETGIQIGRTVMYYVCCWLY